MFIVKVCGAFNSAKIKYVVVGGYAVALNGAVRGTVDLDLAVSLDEKTFLAAEKVLKDLGLESRLPITAKEVFRFRKEYIENRKLIAWSFYDPQHPANQLDIIITEDASSLENKVLLLGGVPIAIATPRALIKMKTASGRPQDLEDIQALKILSEEE
jgi:hypothetical protein